MIGTQRLLIKAGTRSKRGGRTRSVLCKIDRRDIPLPVNWKSYIDLPENKANLTHFLRVQKMLVARSWEGRVPPTMHQNILAYHALTGCDTVSQISGHGKTVHGRYLSNMQHYYLDLDTVYFPPLQ